MMLVNHGGEPKLSFGEPKTQVQLLIGLPGVDMQVETCVEEPSGSTELSGHRTYMMSPWHMLCRSGYMEQSTETQASGLDPAGD
eukprot:14722808-Ditylum_brightwellii.AAC.1